MLKIENAEVVGMEHAIRGMRNPKNSWDKSDTQFYAGSCEACMHEFTDCTNYRQVGGGCVKIGPNDHKLMMTLAKGGPVHAKYRRMIVVYADITAPFYWWKEFDTYKVGTVADSCSTMHKLTAKEFTLDDFSHEHLNEKSLYLLNGLIDYLNVARDIYNNGIDLGGSRVNVVTGERVSGPIVEPHGKDYWYQMIQLLPTSYNQKRTVMLNYEVLVNIYQSRKNHKLDEWHTLCDWIETLPYSELITGGIDNEPKD